MGYNQSFLDQAMSITASMTIVSYALYCIEADMLKDGREFASLPFVAFGVLEYLRLAHVKGAGGSPVDLLLGSPIMMFVGIGWVSAIAWSVAM